MRRDPLGVVGVILPWSGGLSEFFLKVAPALVCGNSVICKPSTLASRALYEVVKALSEIGAPAGLCNLVLGRGATVGQTLVSHPGVRAVSFSGTGSVGETVAKTAAGLMKRTSLRLGSKNAAILLKDCDLTKAVAGTVVSALQWQAESPLSTPRILVHESIQSAFLDGFLTAVRGLRMGDPLEDATQIGPLITERHRHQAQRYWDLAKQEGAKALFGDEPLDLPSTLNQGHFLSPKVLKDLSNCSELHHVDFYAPIVSVQEFKYPHEAIKMANNTQFGRAATLWTQDVKLAHKVANGLQVGAVAINTALAQEPWEVQAATKNSGTSVEGGPRSFDFYTDLKTITLGLE
jgi:aminomuconate-semialdehyde/2-hydroxymuconate-6-semialdehyde dehydrogenase